MLWYKFTDTASPKSVESFLSRPRCGRSGHTPGQSSEIEYVQKWVLKTVFPYLSYKSFVKSGLEKLSIRREDIDTFIHLNHEDNILIQRISIKAFNDTKSR